MTVPLKLDSADAALVEEIISEARIRLQAQLTAGIAADQRAMTFSGLLFAGVAVLVGLAFSKDYQTGHTLELLLVAGGFLVAAALACWSARPVPWHQAGYAPSSYSEDIELGRNFAQTRSETAANYEQLLEDNEKTLQRNAKFMKASMLVAVVSAAAGIMAALLP
jgi:hypothetical protein